MPYLVGYLTPQDYGAAGDGTTDDTLAINNALAATTAGGSCYFPPADYRTSSPIVVPPGVTMKSEWSPMMKVTGLVAPVARIRPLNTFSGAAVVRFLDQATGGYATTSGEQRMVNIFLDGSSLPAGSVHGIQALGNIQNVELSQVTIRSMTGAGISTGVNAGAYPFSWRLHRCFFDSNASHGFTVTNMTDLTCVDTESIGNGGSGWVLTNCPNSQLVGCRAEWNTAQGFYITGAWGSGTGSGGMLMSGCSTDRNTLNGTLIDATGTTPIQVENLMARRDGRNGNTGGGGYAGFNVNAATVPVFASGITCFPGVDDNGTGTNSPQYGAKFTGNTYVAVDSGFLHANTTGWQDGGSNTILRRGPNIGERTGTTAAPVDAFSNPWAAAGNFTSTGYFVAASGQSNGTWTTFDNTAAALKCGTAGGGLTITEGTNARMGESVLVGGTVTVANTSITANTRVFLSRKTIGGTAGNLSYTLNAGVSFVINSSSGTDTSTVEWLLVEKA